MQEQFTQNNNIQASENSKLGNRKYWWIGSGIVLVIIAVAMGIMLKKESIAPLSISQTPQTASVPAQAPRIPGRIFLDAPQNNISSSEEVIVDIRLDTKGVNINLVRTAVTYNPAQLDVVEVNQKDSVLLLDLFKETGQGQVLITRGAPGDADSKDSDDGFTGSDGLLAQIIFKPKQTGTARININAQETSMHVDDGKGTMMELELEGTSIKIQ